MTTGKQTPSSKGDRPCTLDDAWLRAPAAADLIGLSAHTLDAWRKADRKALANGERPSGPPWLERKLGRRLMVAYQRSALIAWATSFWTASGSSPPSTATK